MIRKVCLLILAASLVGGCGSIPKVLGSQPMRFECRDLEGHIYDYEHRGFAELQKGAYGPKDLRRPDPADKGLERLVGKLALDSTATGSAKPRMLVLSGGGQWGAFGAGFLHALPADQKRFDVVTGISTGAIQSLFVGAGNYELMARLYGLEGIGNPAFSNKLKLVTRGSEHNIGPLRKMLNEQLYQQGDDRLLHSIATGQDKPRIFIGLVEGFSTRLKIVDLTAYIKQGYPVGDGPDVHEARTRLADCVTGVVLGSSSIPLRLTPVQIDYREPDEETDEEYELAFGIKRPRYSTFMDGGVRLSVIDRFIEDSAGLAYATAWCRTLKDRNQNCDDKGTKAAKGQDGFQAPGKPEIFIIRNGPTIVPGGSLDAEIDRDPDAYVTALRGYSVLVNQNELASITEIQSRNRYADLYYTSADGYDWNTQPDKPGPERDVCPARDEKNYFDGNFMRCLRKYGTWKYAHSGWQVLSLGNDEGLAPLTDGAPVIPEEALLKRACELLPSSVCKKEEEEGVNDAR